MQRVNSGRQVLYFISAPPPVTRSHCMPQTCLWRTFNSDFYKGYQAPFWVMPICSPQKILSLWVHQFMSLSTSLFALFATLQTPTSIGGQYEDLAASVPTRNITEEVRNVLHDWADISPWVHTVKISLESFNKCDKGTFISVVRSLLISNTSPVAKRNWSPRALLPSRIHYLLFDTRLSSSLILTAANVACRRRQLTPHKADTEQQKTEDSGQTNREAE